MAPKIELDHSLYPLPPMKISSGGSRNKENEENEHVKPEYFSDSKERKHPIFRLFSERKSKYNNDNEKHHKLEDERFQRREDPVIALLEARSMHRVRFCEDEYSVISTKAETTEYPNSNLLDPAESNGTSFNIKTFMGRILYKPSVSENNKGDEAIFAGEFSDEEREGYEAIAWESRGLDRLNLKPEIVHTTSSVTTEPFMPSFVEDPLIRAKALKMLETGQKAQHSHYQYKYALKCYIKAHRLLSDAKYPDNHQVLVKAIRFLNNAHHILNCLISSAKIVKMGIKYEESGDLVKALKMYTIAYRIRRDQISETHPSLLALLNILGSIQIKRGELQEAMRVFELALKDSNAINSTDCNCAIPSNLLARAITLREMGVIQDKWNNTESALKLYHRSLNCISEWHQQTAAQIPTSEDFHIETPSTDMVINLDLSSQLLENLYLAKSFPLKVNCMQENGFEILVNDSQQELHLSGHTGMAEHYNSFFSKKNSLRAEKSSSKPNFSDSCVDVEVSLTLHQIAQTYKRQGEYGKAIDAYKASLRGMKKSLGELHPNVAAVLGNLGNLQKELGDLDGAYYTYQEVLGIESSLLGVSHPEVAISLHNVATIEAYRGNYETSIAIYKKVLSLQRKLFGGDTIAVANTSASMGDVHERLGRLPKAVECYEESLRAKIAVLGRHNIEIARLFHKLGKIAFAQQDYHLADSYTSRAVLIYRLNEVSDDHEWIIACERDLGDIDGAIALGNGKYFQC
mmetsp:Transcript_14074/g.21502  ORF Transcript_14074/g.21502 Transcript_14074/m.21502 type:complete len:745 (+) Transcript_14074:108-2342(+)|eukprot:CAMPEP_0178898324 /NCGR_PEP_ID=MMETSP0786-20121207/2268_1 /TAXON_ID=186022 /ORGANISM="Thalassionema frauenfeldii, Strain CCMP 1798" /LENGTH=744 /DNA_ID=CAMNT_0020569031 /DNA_START=45 /DNA_END=2279 /DNA_ORIENTATION=-